MAQKRQKRIRNKPYMRKAAIFGGENNLKTKAVQATRIKTRDVFDYTLTDAIKPPIDPDILSNYMLTCTEHEAAVNLKANTIISKFIPEIVGGREIKRKQEGSDSVDTEEKKVHNFIANINPVIPAEELFRRGQRDYHGIGGQYYEVLRYKDKTIQQLNHAPAKDMRIRKNKIGYIQYLGEDIYVYFKLVGDTDLPMSWKTGKIDLSAKEIRDYYWETHRIQISGVDAKELVAEGKDYNNKDSATEMLSFQNYHPSQSIYGLPDAISCLTEMDILEKAYDYNYYFFGNHAMARYIMFIKGPEGAITDEQMEVIENYIEAAHKGETNVGKTLLLELPNDVEVMIEKVDVDIKEGSFDRLMSRCEQAIARAEGVPLELLQIPVPQGLGGKKLYYLLQQFKEHVVDPGQSLFVHNINKNIIWSEHGLNIKNVQLGLKKFDIDKTAEDVDAYTRVDKIDSMSTREKRAFAKGLGSFSVVDTEKAKSGEDILFKTGNVQPLSYFAETAEKGDVKKPAALKVAEGLEQVKKGIVQMVVKNNEIKEYGDEEDEYEYEEVEIDE